MKRVKFSETAATARKFSAWLLLILPCCLGAQAVPADSLQLIHTLPAKGKFFTVDKLQQVYLVTPKNEVVKYTPTGQEQFRYNNNTRGALTYIDATDPFNLLLFYPDFQTVAALDRTMNETAVLLLYAGGLVNASAIGLAVDNNIWVYDQAAFRLLKLRQDGSIVLASDNLSAQLGEPPFGTQLVAHENLLYLNDPDKGVFVFDNFGQYHQMLPFEEVVQIQMLDGVLLIYQKEGVRAYDPRSLSERILRLPEQARQARQIRWQGRRLYVLSPEGNLQVYQRQ